MADFPDSTRLDQRFDAGRCGGVRGVAPCVHHILGGELFRQRLEVLAGLVVDDACLRVTLLVVEVVLPHQTEQGFLAGLFLRSDRH